MKRWLFALAGLLLATEIPAAEWSGRVVGVHDGDTLSVLRDGKAVKVRLNQIDAPELGQDYGRQSKKSLSALCYGQWAEVRDEGEDKYGRVLGRVHCGGADANAEQIRRGYAWFYVQYGRDPALRTLEASARARGAGLWASSRPIPPWDFRHEAHSGSGGAARPDPHRGSTSRSFRNRDDCAGRSTCADFASCEEALYYLHRCGLTRLDRNHDGVPCESTLCR